MKQRSVYRLAILSLPILALAIPLLVVNAASGDAIAELDSPRGDVAVIRRGRGMTTYSGLPLERADVVRTRRGRATIQFSDGTEVQVRPNSRIQVTERAKKRTVEVFFGRLWARIAKQREGQTQFQSGGTIAAIRGTVIEQEVDEFGKIRFGVSEGESVLTIEQPDGSTATVTVRTGQWIEVLPDGTFNGPNENFNPSDIAGEDGPTFAVPTDIDLKRVIGGDGANPWGPNPLMAGTPLPTPSPTPTPTPTPPPSTPTPTPIPTATPTPTPAPQPQPQPQPTQEPEPTVTPTPTPTPTPPTCAEIGQDCAIEEVLNVGDELSCCDGLTCGFDDQTEGYECCISDDTNIQCTADDQCCYGLVCNDGGACVEPCGAVGDECNVADLDGPANCCEEGLDCELRDEDGYFCCIPEGESGDCEVDNDCCGDYICDSDQCVDPCGDIGDDCSIPEVGPGSNCCQDDLECDGEVSTCCIGVDTTERLCESDSDCCTDLTCNTDTGSCEFPASCGLAGDPCEDLGSSGSPGAGTPPPETPFSCCEGDLECTSPVEGYCCIPPGAPETCTPGRGLDYCCPGSFCNGSGCETCIEIFQPCTIEGGVLTGPSGPQCCPDTYCDFQSGTCMRGVLSNRGAGATGAARRTLTGRERAVQERDNPARNPGARQEKRGRGERDN